MLAVVYAPCSRAPPSFRGQRVSARLNPASICKLSETREINRIDKAVVNMSGCGGVEHTPSGLNTGFHNVDVRLSIAYVAQLRTRNFAFLSLSFVLADYLLLLFLKTPVSSFHLSALEMAESWTQISENVLKFY